MASLKEELLQAIETAPDGAIEQTLIYLKALLQNQPSLHPGSGRSLLRHAGKWQGDDFEDCLEAVYKSRSDAQF